MIITYVCIYCLHHRHWIKAGRLVGSADYYAVIALADNATFLLAVNRMVAFPPQSPNRWHFSRFISCCRASALELWGCRFNSHLGQSDSHVCAHFGILGLCGIILSRFRLRGQLQYRTALHQGVYSLLTSDSYLPVGSISSICNTNPPIFHQKIKSLQEVNHNDD